MMGGWRCMCVEWGGIQWCYDYVVGWVILVLCTQREGWTAGDVVYGLEKGEKVYLYHCYVYDHLGNLFVSD